VLFLPWIVAVRERGDCEVWLIYDNSSLTRPQLLAVTETLNQAKGDQDLAEWLPPRVAYQCEYVRAWVQVKSYYGLTMDSAEKAAASKVLTGC
jgi:hypothetical protein